jgi:branched-chain amino acid aminotransferase
MSQLQFFALSEQGIQPLPVPAEAQEFTDLYAGLTLGVYSALRTFAHNRFLYLDHHLARTVTSMQLLGWKYELNEGRLRQAIHTVCTAYPFAEMRLRIDILAEPARSLGTESRELLALMPFTPLPATYYTQGVSVGLAKGVGRTDPRIKTAAFANVRKQYASSAASHYEELMVSAQGEILEGLSSNFYAVLGGNLHTAGSGVLEGITRKIILDLANQMGIPLSLEPVRQDQLRSLQEAAISSSSRGWLPVVKIDDQIIGNGCPGPISQQIIAAYDAFVAREAKPAIEV